MNLAFKIHGMDCAEEVAILKQEVGPVVGGADNLAFDLLRCKMTIVGGNADVASADILRAIDKAGMKAEPWAEGSKLIATPQTFWETNGRVVTMVAAGAFTLGGFLHHAISSASVQAALGSEGLGVAHAVPWIVRFYYAVAILAGGWYVAPKALLSVRRLRPDMNLLMTIAVIGAVIIGEWLEAALVSFLFAFSLALESWSVGRARHAVEALLDLVPPAVRLLREGREIEVPAETVPVGSLFLVKPGDRIPLDGEVVRGTTDVNQAPITGESLPVLKGAGDEVFAGTINGNGAIEILSTKVASDTALARIIEMVGSAQAKRAPSEQWVERFARYYTPVVFAAAILVLLVPPLLFAGGWSEWTYRALVLLVIGCPCALVISTPVSIVAALTAAAKNGVLIKGGMFVEIPARLKAIAMDKTGTLTEGKPRVTKVLPETGIAEHDLIEIAASMESQSDHPLARAIMECAYEKGIAPQTVTNFTAIQGMGATCTVAGRSYWLGSHRYLEVRKEETPEIHARLEALAAGGESVVVVGDDQRVIGMITLADTVRANSSRTLEFMRLAGIEHIVMLTGDNRPTAEAIARSVGIDELYPELLPEDKVKSIEKLVDRYKQVAMVGDGVNDAPAMARATLGIAMGVAGSDAAIEAADIALMSDDLSKIPWLIQHSKRALSIIRQNITLSLAVKAIFVVLTFGGFASLWAAIAADMGVSLLVIFNALRLLRTRTVFSSYKGEPMRKHISLAVITFLFIFGASCTAQKSEPKGPDYNLVGTIKDIMDSQVDPSASFIWESVSTMVTPTGSVTKAPRNSEEWKEVRRRAITLLEATNLLIMPGRRVAQPGEKADDPKVELAPEEIEALINQDRASWNMHVQALFDSTMETLKTIDAKDADGLFDISNKIDAACEACHKKYWYPNDPGPPVGDPSSTPVSK